MKSSTMQQLPYQSYAKPDSILFKIPGSTIIHTSPILLFEDGQHQLKLKLKTGEISRNQFKFKIHHLKELCEHLEQCWKYRK